MLLFNKYITGVETIYLHTGRIAQAAADPLADEFTSCMEVLMFPSNNRRKRCWKKIIVKYQNKNQPSKIIFE